MTNRGIPIVFQFNAYRIGQYVFLTYQRAIGFHERGSYDHPMLIAPKISIFCLNQAA